MSLGPSDPPLRPHRPHHRQLRRSRRRACSAGRQGAQAVYAFVSLDSIPLEPHFRTARQQGTVEAVELDEGMFLLGLQAAAWRVPFLPTRAGLGSDVLRMPDDSSPSPPRTSTMAREELVAVPSLRSTWRSST